MSFHKLLNRTVTIVPMNVVSVDRYGNEIRGEGTPVTGVAARRNQSEATEELLDRDQQSRTFRYWLPAGTAISGRDRIVDGADTLEVEGEPATLHGHSAAHHLEVRAYLIT